MVTHESVETKDKSYIVSSVWVFGITQYQWIDQVIFLTVQWKNAALKKNRVSKIAIICWFLNKWAYFIFNPLYHYPLSPRMICSESHNIFQKIWRKAQLNSEFTFSSTGCLINAKTFSLCYYLLIARLLLFPIVLARSETQISSCKVWTRVADSTWWLQ